MKKVGITGGIGSGKSVICAYLAREFDVPVYYSDDEARYLMENDPKLVYLVKQKFGDQCYTGNKLNRAYLGSIVFSDKTKLAELNAVVHPVVRRDMQAWFKSQELKGESMALVESAIMFESGMADMLDCTVAVFADEHTRKIRVMNRDKCDEATAASKMASQMSKEEKMRLATYSIDNSSNNIIHPHSDVGKLLAKLYYDITGVMKMPHNFNDMLDDQFM